jgi:hypothetical protein
MGWFDKILKKASGEPEEPEEPVEETVDLSKLAKWVDDKSNEGFNKVRPEIEELFLKLKREKKELLTNLDTLNDAELHNPNISEREKNLMEGNRQSYISQHKQFVNMAEFSEELTCKETSLFCKNFEDMLVKLAKSTARGHMVMNEFFADHANKINRKIRDMGDIVQKVKGLLEEGNVGIDEIDNVQKAVSELRGKNKLLTEIEEDLQIYDKKLANSHQLKEKIVKSIEKLKQTESYNKFKEADSEKEELQDKMKHTEDAVSALFSHIDKPMRKYERVIVEGADLFSKYMDNPMKALVSDENIAIIGILSKMKDAISESRLELKDPEKAKLRIGEIDKESLSRARTRYVDAKRSIKIIDEKVRNINVLQDMDDLKYKIEHTDNQIQILKDKIEQAKKTKEKIDLEKLREQVKEKIKEVFNIEVTITWQGNSPIQSQSSSSE